MALLEKHLEVKKSTIPGAGKGLFTKKPIAKGTYIIEYTGTITTWKDVDHDEGANVYIYYVNRKHVIDASKNTKSLARYANDARGLQRPKGFRNNSQYVNDEDHIYIQALRDIPAGDEILVSYGKEYWDVIRKNHQIEANKLKRQLTQQENSRKKQLG
ncbi:MAG: SET domain-containing protein [Ferruginibacter sp.]|nr:SET domain-containing protein [Ferruginibacter sp.]